MRYWVLLLALSSAPALASAQPLELSTGYQSDNGQAGCQFDLVAREDLRLSGLDVNLDAGTWDIEVWTTPGSIVGREQDPAAWTRVASAMGVRSIAADRPTRLPISLCIPVTRGATLGLYVTCRNGVGVNYRDGTGVGSTAASNDDLEILEGAGIVHPFGPFFPGRVFSGTIYYELGMGTTCAPLPPPAPPPYQRNQPTASFDVDGVETTGLDPVVLTRCVDQAMQAGFAASAGAMWELAWHSGALVREGTLLASETQRLNLDPTAADLVYLFGGGAPLPTALPAASVSVPFSLPTPGLRAAQAAIFDAAHPDGLVLTQAVELQIVTSSPAPPGPTRDEELVTLDLSDSPLCQEPLVFAGTTWERVHVSANGRVQFGPPTSDFSPSVAEALSGPGFFGVWGDLDPGSGGAVRIDFPGAGGLSVEWDGVPPFVGGGTPVRFRASLDANGAIAIAGLGAGSLEDGLRGWRRDAYLGLSPGGAAGAMDLGPSTFQGGSSASASSAAELLYRFGPANQLLAGRGVVFLTFTPDAAGVYTWSGQ